MATSQSKKNSKCNFHECPSHHHLLSNDEDKFPIYRADGQIQSQSGMCNNILVKVLFHNAFQLFKIMFVSILNRKFPDQNALLRVFTLVITNNLGLALAYVYCMCKNGVSARFYNNLEFNFLDICGLKYSSEFNHLKII